MVKIGNKKIGDGENCFITFEAGPTHNGFESAKRLARLAKQAGADAIKFQIIDPERIMGDKNIRFKFGVLAENGRITYKEENLYKLLKQRSMSKKEWSDLKQYCDSINLPFFATVGFEDEVDFVYDLGCESIKIASADINHHPLIKYAAQTGLCIQIDTGNSTLGEIEKAVDIILAQGNENIIIHHCPSGYPSRLEGINLNIIKTLKEMFEFPIGFSDHTPEMDMDIAAVALGANLIEKTITENRMTQSVEHVMSLEPEEMKKFIERIRNIEKAFGHSRRIMTDKERHARYIGRRSAYVKADLKKGEKIGLDDIEYRRPGDGIPPSVHDKLVGTPVTRDLKQGEKLSWSDLDLNEFVRNGGNFE